MALEPFFEWQIIFNSGAISFTLSLPSKQGLISVETAGDWHVAVIEREASQMSGLHGNSESDNSFTWTLKTEEDCLL